ncbi:unnamed protein product [Rhizoctonia solani]|uniref:Zn(2)-C6 fungal-type domain-containing protein n=1 Tax=Rhizoctonia solani TaxID=456999 RepID=A0A8H3C6U9_9AGAM|nr:unnamed protein product [Rhizoctonia solani]
MPSSSSSSTAQTNRSTRSGVSLTRNSNNCVTCRVRHKKCGGFDAGQTSCNDCLRLNIQCLGISHNRPDWLRNPEALKETKYRIKRHLTEHPVPRGRGLDPGRPHLDFCDLIERYSPRTSTPEEHDRSVEVGQLQRMMPEILSPTTDYSSGYLSNSLADGYSPTRWPTPEPSPSPSYTPTPFWSTYTGGSLFVSPGGMINQGFSYTQQDYRDQLFTDATYYSYNPHVPDEPYFTSPISPYPEYVLGVPKGVFPTHPEAHPRTEPIKTYYTVYMGLLHDSGSRKALPLELVLHICRLAGFERWHAKAAPNCKGVYEHGSRMQSLAWFQTDPFTKQMLSHTKSIQLVTVLDSQALMGDHSIGWFEIQVVQPAKQDTTIAKVKRRLNGDEISWYSHSNTGTGTARLQGYFTEHKGVVFDSDHELWDQVEEGDVLQVVAKAPLHSCSYTASDGILRISTWWEPSPEMLDLMDKREAQSK